MQRSDSGKFKPHIHEGKMKGLSKKRNSYPMKTVDRASLVFSSMFFLIPSFFATHCHSHIFSYISFIVSLVSINFWRFPMNGWRRNIDIATAKLSFIVYFSCGCYFVRDLYHITLGWIICITMLFCYFMSGKLWYADSPHWIHFHMMFHFLVAFEQCLIIASTSEECKNSFIF